MCAFGVRTCPSYFFSQRRQNILLISSRERVAGAPALRSKIMSVSLAPTPVAVSTVVKSRMASIDLIRGAVMILMAIDHVRVFSGVPAGGPTLGVFFTRWITHFCAPAFFFLAGTSAFLSSRTRADLSRYLVIRGALLIVLELTLLRVAWTFNTGLASYQ